MESISNKKRMIMDHKTNEINTSWDSDNIKPRYGVILRVLMEGFSCYRGKFEYRMSEDHKVLQKAYVWKKGEIDPSEVTWLVTDLDNLHNFITFVDKMTDEEYMRSTVQLMAQSLPNLLTDIR